MRVLGKPFREADHATGAIVALAEKKGVELGGLSLTDTQTIEPGITADVVKVLTVEASAASRKKFAELACHCAA